MRAFTTDGPGVDPDNRASVPLETFLNISGGVWNSLWSLERKPILNRGLIERDAQAVDGARKFGGVGNVSFGLGFQPGQGFFDQHHDFSRGEVIGESKGNGVPVRTGRDNGGPVGDFGGEAGFENGLQRRLRVTGLFSRAPRMMQRMSATRLTFIQGSGNVSE